MLPKHSNCLYIEKHVRFRIGIARNSRGRKNSYSYALIHYIHSQYSVYWLKHTLQVHVLFFWLAHTCHHIRQHGWSLSTTHLQTAYSYAGLYMSYSNYEMWIKEGNAIEFWDIIANEHWCSNYLKNWELNRKK